jgi:hypothetical protein
MSTAAAQPANDAAPAAVSRGKREVAVDDSARFADPHRGVAAKEADVRENQQQTARDDTQATNVIPTQGRETSENIVSHSSPPTTPPGKDADEASDGPVSSLESTFEGLAHEGADGIHEERHHVGGAMHDAINIGAGGDAVEQTSNQPQPHRPLSESTPLEQDNGAPVHEKKSPVVFADAPPGAAKKEKRSPLRYKGTIYEDGDSQSSISEADCIPNVDAELLDCLTKHLGAAPTSAGPLDIGDGSICTASAPEEDDSTRCAGARKSEPAVGDSEENADDPMMTTETTHDGACRQPDVGVDQ